MGVYYLMEQLCQSIRAGILSSSQTNGACIEKFDTGPESIRIIIS
jgi:hypothetical protein